jgi:branched-chain amino acid transport system permease protein
MYLEQLILVGLLTGAVLGLVGVGFTIVVGVGRIANFAHGSMVGAGMYVGYWISTDLHISLYAMLIPALVAFLIIGWAVAELFERRGRRVGAIGELLIGLSLLLLINGLLAFLFGSNPLSVSDVNLGSVQAFGLNVPGTETLAASFTFVIAVAMYFFFRQARWGRALRAVAQNPAAAAMYGIRVPIAQRVAVTISVAIAGISGILISPFSVLTPDTGTNFLITAFAVVIIGGIGNTLGAVLAGLGLGVVETLATGYLSTAWTTLAPLLLLLAFLLARPLQVDQ